MERLEDLYFLEIVDSRYILKPSIIGSIQQHIELTTGTKKDYITKICNFYQKFMQESYKKVGKAGKGDTGTEE